MNKQEELWEKGDEKWDKLKRKVVRNLEGFRWMTPHTNFLEFIGESSFDFGTSTTHLRIFAEIVSNYNSTEELRDAIFNRIAELDKENDVPSEVSE